MPRDFKEKNNFSSWRVFSLVCIHVLKLQFSFCLLFIAINWLTAARSNDVYILITRISLLIRLKQLYKVIIKIPFKKFFFWFMSARKEVHIVYCVYLCMFLLLLRFLYMNCGSKNFLFQRETLERTKIFRKLLLILVF